MAQHLYTYYKVYEFIAQDIHPQAQALLESMQFYCSRTALRKRGDGVEYETWMEVYEDIAPQFKTAYTQQLARADFALLKQLERHEEWFEDVA